MAAAAHSEPTPRSVKSGVVWFRSLQQRKSKLDLKMKKIKRI